MSKKPKRPRDINQLAKFTIDVATGEEELPENKPSGKNPAAVALGKLGGKKDGKARAAKLTAEQRQAIARKAAVSRWNKHEQSIPMTTERELLATLEISYWNEIVAYFEAMPEHLRPPSYKKCAVMRETIALSQAETR